MGAWNKRRYAIGENKTKYTSLSMDALSQALGNAAQNSRNNNDTLYVENLDDIGNPVESQPESLSESDNVEIKLRHSEVYKQLIAESKVLAESKAQSESLSETNNAEIRLRHSEVYKQFVAESKANYKPPEFKEGDYFTNQNQLSFHSLDFNVGELVNSVMYLHQKVDAITTTIQQAASTMPPEPDLKHRSLHEWDDNYLINELVERENSLMPFYFELLKRIPPDLQPYVQESMNGKYQSLSVLSKLCAALSYGKTQPQQAGLSPEAEQRLDNAFNTVMSQPQQSTIPRAPFPTGNQTYNPYRG